jgi:hypothetical protein
MVIDIAVAATIPIFPEDSFDIDKLLSTSHKVAYRHDGIQLDEMKA